MKKYFLMFFSLIAIFSCKAQVQQQQESQAEISISTKDGITTVSGYFVNDGTKKSELIYKLKVERDGKSGKTSSNQGGKFDAKADEKVLLSTSGVNISEGDEYTFTLTILDSDGNIIAENKKTQNDQ